MFKNNNHLFLFGIHAFLAFLFVLSSTIAYIFGILILAGGLFYIINQRNRNDEAALLAGYMVGLEVVLRIAKASLSYEMGKYAVIIFLLTGLFVETKKTYLPRQFLLFIILLLPALTIIDYDSFVEGRKAVLFNLSGPLSLGISALYFYQRSFSQKLVKNLLLSLILPIFTLSIVLFFLTPDFSEVQFGTTSNSELSGGFGPNQVSTILGLGVFLVGLAFISNINLTGLKIVDIGIFLFLILRGLLTFSRGGIFTALLALVAAFVVKLFYNNNKKVLTQVIVGTIVIAIAGFFVWSYTNKLTGGVLEMRYAGRSINDPNKVNFTAGRLELIALEMEAFTENPVLGVGVGMGKSFRVQHGGRDLAAHTEYTRLLGEHGIYGLIALLIILLSPLFYFFKVNAENKFFIIGFIIVSLLTMFHAAMRLAMPGFVYGISFIYLAGKTTSDTSVRPDLHT